MVVTDYMNPDFQDPLFQDKIQYDIESTKNVFTNALFVPHDNRIDLFYDVDERQADEELSSALRNGTHENQKLIDHIIKVNPCLKNTNFNFYNVNQPSSIIAWLFRFGYLYSGRDLNNGINRFYYDKKTDTLKVNQNAINFNHNNSGVPLSFAPISDLALEAFAIIKNKHSLKNIDDVIHQIINENKEKVVIQNPTNHNNFLTNYSRYQYLGFNARNYDLTMLALFNAHLNQRMINELSQIVIELLNARNNPALTNKAIKHLQVINQKYQGKVFLEEQDFDTQSTSPAIDNLACMMRRYNNKLFEQSYMPSVLFTSENQVANSIFRNWHNSGRYVDIFDQSSYEAISLKNMAGNIGRQIKESNKLNDEIPIKTKEQLADLIAYNICDILNTAGVYATLDCQNEVSKRKALIKDYPVTLYDKTAHFEEDSPLTADEKLYNLNHIDHKRLILDDTSANYVTRIVAPYKPLNDKPGVDLTFPHKLDNNDDFDKSKKHREEVNQWVKEHRQTIIDPILQHYHQKHIHDKIQLDDRYIPSSSVNDPETCCYDALDDTLYWAWQQDQKYPNAHVLDEIAPVYAFYNGLRGHNFNDSVKNAPFNVDRSQLKEYSKNWSSQELVRFYRDENGNQTPFVAAFKLGGIHGAEVQKDALNIMQTLFEKKGPETKKAINDAIQKLIDKGEIKDKKEAFNRNLELKIPSVFGNKKVRATLILQRNGTIKSPRSEPTLLDKDGKVRKEFRKTSNNLADGRTLLVFHIDFASYYPTLSVRMRLYETLENGVRVDRFNKMYHRRLKIKALSKKTHHDDGTPYTEIEKEELTLSANGLKLVINAGTGQADRPVDNNLRMNNNILAMRTIGQLFAWRIGQALALKGAQIVSTNTDGLFIYVDPNDPNPEHLHNHDEVQATVDDVIKNMFIGVDAEDLAQFVSKDTNNRVEIQRNKDNNKYIDNAGGSDTTAWKDNKLLKKTAKPPILDRILAEYVLRDDLDLSQELDQAYAKKLFQNKINEAIKADENQDNPTHVRDLLKRIGWILNSSPGKKRFVFANHLTKDYLMSYKPNKQGFNTISDSLARKYNRFMPVLTKDQNGKQVPKVDILQKNNRVYLTIPDENDTEFTTLNVVAHRKLAKTKATPNPIAENNGTFANYLMQQFLTPSQYQKACTDSRELFTITKYSKVPTAEYTNVNDLPAWANPKLIDLSQQQNILQVENEGIKFNGETTDKTTYTNTQISTQPVKIVNQNLNDLTQEERLDLIKHLDLDAYIGILAQAYETWKN